MTPFLQISGDKAIAIFKRRGFAQVSQRGSHVKLRDADGHCVIIPRHPTLAQGTLNSILAQAGVSFEEFARWLRA